MRNPSLSRFCFLQSLLFFYCLLSQAAVNPAAPVALANDNRTPAGAIRNGTLNLHLEMVEAVWYPDQESGRSFPIYAFAEKGKPPQIPGPLVRVPLGTNVRMEVRNALPVAMFLRGLGSSGPVSVAPGAVANIRFTAGAAGSYFYSARSCAMSLHDLGTLPVTEDLPMGEGPFGIESQLDGGLIVDSPGSKPEDRVFMITTWMAGVITPPFREILAINGKSWPHTERLSYQTGEAARWRVLNASLSDHAMHLHGFYFEVNSTGDQDHDHVYPAGESRHAVTQYLPPGDTASITWIPERPGRWLFHCHMMAHMAPVGDASAHDSHPSAPETDNPTGMKGLVLGITVSPGPGYRAAAPSGQEPRRLQLLVREIPATRFSLPRMGYLIQEPGAKDAGAQPPVPGAPLVLTRGQTTEITVENQLHEPTAVHWHGIELESYYDGVPGWGGDSPQVTPAIPPGGTFVARMTPPRTGTFIYHTHWHDAGQLSGGLYGPLIVLEPGEKFDPSVDKIFIIGREGPDEDLSPLLLNGFSQPPPLVLKRGTRYRFRFINIGIDDSDATLSLVTDLAKPVQWRALAKDGWTLPPSQAAVVTATQIITVGETYDFEFTPDGVTELKLDVRLPFLKTQLSQSIVVH